MMDRRQFMTRALAAGTAAAATTAAAPGRREARAEERESRRPAFHLNYAPHFGMFRHSAGDDPLEQLRFARDHGFTAWEDNGMKGRPVEQQRRIAREMGRLGMTMGVFVAHASFDRPTFTVRDQRVWEGVLAEVRESVEVARRVNARWVTVVPGSVDQQAEGGDSWNRYGGPRLAPGYQRANVIELLRRCAAILEPHGLVMVLEPLNWLRDHGGVFLRYSDQAYALCRAVDSPSCGILFDIYHQQITEGNLIPNIDRCWDRIAYFQIGDHPGRNEPTTGEINYRNVLRHIHAKGYEGVLGMEHGNSQPGPEGELAVIEAYRRVDDF